MSQAQFSAFPNSLIPKALASYASVEVPKRRAGKLEERLRAEVRRRVTGQRGRNKELAKLLGRPPSWVTEYMGGENHANLDTSLHLLRFVGWTLSKDLSDFAEPQIPPEWRDAIAVMARLTDDQREALLRLAHELAGEPAAERPIETIQETSTKAARGRRRHQ